MNVSIFKDVKYLNLMREKIPNLIQIFENLDPHLKWEMIKKEIKEFTQKIL